MKYIPKIPTVIVGRIHTQSLADRGDAEGLRAWHGEAQRQARDEGKTARTRAEWANFADDVRWAIKTLRKERTV